MINVINVSNYVKIDSNFVEVEPTEYIITYLKGLRGKVHRLRVVVNGRITKHYINILDYRQKYKDVLLSAISDFKHGLIKDKSIVTKSLKIDFINSLHKDHNILAKRNINNYLLSITSEKNRDRLTEFNLFDNGFGYCQSNEEDRGMCYEQCEHCAIYYKDLENGF